MTEENDDWQVEASDDEVYGPTKGVWEPAPEDIVELYNKILKDSVLELQWVCPGRKSLQEETENTEQTQNPNEGKEEEKKLEVPAAPTEFDFDESSEMNPITPRRTPGSAKTPRSHKRVANMDKIWNDFMQEKKKETAKASPVGTPKRADIAKLAIQLETPKRPEIKIETPVETPKRPEIKIETPVEQPKRPEIPKLRITREMLNS